MPEKHRKVGVIVRGGAASEQLRMATGLTTLHNDMVVVIADDIIRPEGVSAEHIEAMGLLGVRLLTNRKDNPFEYMEDRLLSELLAGCDIVLS